jgi:hypothetical protein
VEARDALMGRPTEQLRRSGVSASELAKIEEHRTRHASLYSKWTAFTLTPRELRIALVDYYAAQGRERLEARFFPK